MSIVFIGSCCDLNLNLFMLKGEMGHLLNLPYHHTSMFELIVFVNKSVSKTRKGLL